MSDTDTDTNEPQTDMAGPATDPAPDAPAQDADAVTDDDGAAEPGAEAGDAAEVAELPEADAEVAAAPDETVAAPDAEVTEAGAVADEAPAEAAAAPAADEAGDGAAEAAVDEAPDAALDEAAEAGAAVDQAAEAAVDEAAEAGVDEAAEVEPAANGQAAAAEPAEAVGDEVITADELLERPPAESPYDRPGRWFVVHTQSGYEKKVKQNLEARIVSMNAEDAIYEVVIPMEDYVDFRNGKRIVAQRKMFPGYLLVRAALDDQAWFVIRNTPGVTGFVGQGAKPSPLPRRDVEAFLMPKGGTEEQVAQRAKPRLEYEIGETVRVKEGPFADFSGEVIELNEDQLKLKVLVNIFGRETPVELEFSKVAKL
jgi:transcriptional antiterminator NusG